MILQAIDGRVALLAVLALVIVASLIVRPARRQQHRARHAPDSPAVDPRRKVTYSPHDPSEDGLPNHGDKWIRPDGSVLLWDGWEDEWYQVRLPKPQPAWWEPK